MKMVLNLLDQAGKIAVVFLGSDDNMFRDFGPLGAIALAPVLLTAVAVVGISWGAGKLYDAVASNHVKSGFESMHRTVAR